MPLTVIASASGQRVAAAPTSFNQIDSTCGSSTSVGSHGEKDIKPRTSSSHSSNSNHPHSSSLSASSSSSAVSTRASSSPVSHVVAGRRSLHLHVNVFSKRKGVRYNADGDVLACRFCEILRARSEPFLYEDESVVVFRPLRPIVPSHVLIVPRAHIRNVNQLAVDDVALVRHMRVVAGKVLHTLSNTTNNNCEETNKDRHQHYASNQAEVCVDECLGVDDTVAADWRFAFHVPPFNSIDHVHMHAFQGSTGYLGRIKYKSNSWWCRSFDQVLARLEDQKEAEIPTSEAAARAGIY